MLTKIAQPQAPAPAPAPATAAGVSQIADGQPQAPTSASGIRYTGAASKPTGHAMAGLAGAAMMLML